ncbi:MAG: NAD(P)/FAD-dependent oxidoreductase [Gemmatimonadetes bacterium]|nr:NAD(P)/FAD-dependent oxidoreductase [Gemmatimonadota bacterium]
MVGGGFGGLFAARALCRTAVAITLIDRNNYHLFQPLLYQVATASLAPSEIAQPIRSILRRQANVRVVLGEVEAVDLDARAVRTSTGTSFGYDYLVLATGNRHAYFGHDDWEPLAPGLKSLEDAREIRRRFLLAYERAEVEPDPLRQAALTTSVVVGGGPTGVELAGSMIEIARHTIRRDFRNFDSCDTRVVLLEGGDRILPGYGEALSRKAAESLRRLGVEVRTGAVVTEVEEGGVWIGAERIAAANVFWAAGNVASPLTRGLGGDLDRHGRVAVAPDLSLPGRPEVFVLGDIALFPGEDGEPLPGVAPVAMQQARCAASNIRRLLAGTRTRAFRYRDKGSLATIGRSAAVARFGPVRLWGFPAWAAWLGVHIFFLIGFRNRLLVLIQWAWSYLTYQRGARIISRKEW